MADLWSHQFCLACDKQVESDSAAYCSESCRLTELERDSATSSQASSPSLNPTSYPWSSTTSQSSSAAKFSMSPFYDYSSSHRYSSTPAQQKSFFGNYTMGSEQSKRTLSPSSSHTSLCSMQSSSSTETSNLSDRVTKELRAYAVSFEHVNSQRRRSY